MQAAAAVLAVASRSCRAGATVAVAALGAAVLIALQLGVTHWFYLYLVWFLPLVLVALLARHAAPARSSAARERREPVGAADERRP